MFFVSHGLVSRLVADRDLFRYANATAARVGGRKRGSWKPWEDVFLGYALSAMSAASSRMLVVDIGWALYYEQWGFKVRPATMLWHAKGGKDANRIRALHHWATGHHCTSPTTSSSLVSCFSKRGKRVPQRTMTRLRRRSSCHAGDARRPFETNQSAFGWRMCTLPKSTAACSDEEVRLVKPVSSSSSSASAVVTSSLVS